MDAAVAGLAGVVVGGLISTGWSWAALIRQELAEAVVAARLLTADLDSLSAGTPRSDMKSWEANRTALARVLGHSQWEAVAAAYRDPSALPSADTLRLAVQALEPLSRGKRFVTRQRVANFFRGSRPGQRG